MNKIKQNKKAILLLIVGLTLMVIGVIRQENDLILTKAINICLECIGIG